jgi:hypothetical protein
VLASKRSYPSCVPKSCQELQIQIWRTKGSAESSEVLYTWHTFLFISKIENDYLSDFLQSVVISIEAGIAYNYYYYYESHLPCFCINNLEALFFILTKITCYSSPITIVFNCIFTSANTSSKKKKTKSLRIIFVEVIATIRPVFENSLLILLRPKPSSLHKAKH